MKTSDDLFRLVKSLSPAEKKYCKRMFSRHTTSSSIEKNDYVQLFDIVDSMSAWDEAIFKKKISKYGFAPRISAVKNYLISLLTEAMRSYAIGSTAQHLLLEMLADIAIFWKRNLKDMALKLILKAKVLARQHEEWELALKIQNWHLLAAESQPHKKADVLLLFEEKQYLLDHLNNVDHYRMLNSAIHEIFAQGAVTSEQTTRELAVILSDPLLSREECALSHAAKLIFHDIHIISEKLIKKQPETTIYHTRRRLELHYERPDFITEKPLSYITSVHRHVQRCIIFGLLDEAEDTLKKFDTTIVHIADKLYESYRIEAAIMNMSMEVLLILNTGNLQYIHSKHSRWKRGIVLYQEAMELQFTRGLCFNIALLFYFAQSWTDALYWLTKSMEYNLEVIPEIVAAGKMMSIMVHYELGNYSLIESLVRSTSRYLKKHNFLGRSEQKVLLFFNQLSNTAEFTPQSPEPFRKMLAYLEKHSEDTRFSSIEFFDFRLWLRSKIEGVPLTELYQQKVRIKE
ncbi:MAG: hypothetical protein U0264_14295 [Candidatus Kapaibacterium sp.]